MDPDREASQLADGAVRGHQVEGYNSATHGGGSAYRGDVPVLVASDVSDNIGGDIYEVLTEPEPALALP